MKHSKLAAFAATLLLLFTGLVLVPTVPAANAASLPAASGLRAVYGDRTLTITWSRVSGATSYRVQYATGSHFSGSHTTGVTSGTTSTLRGLTNNRRYYVRVLAYLGRAHSTSSTISSTPASGYPTVLPTPVLTPGPGDNQLTVSWPRLQKATQVVVMAAADNALSDHFFHSSWLPATATSTVLTVPSSWQTFLGTGSSRPLYVRVGEFNRSNTQSTVYRSMNYNADYRISYANHFSFAKEIPGSGTPLRVAEYNVQAATSSPSGLPWTIRRDRVAATIAYSNADIVGTSEVDATDSTKSLTPTGLEQQDDLETLLGQSKYGSYQLSGEIPANYKWNNALTDGWIYYKPSVLTRLDGGFLSPRDDLNIGWPQSEGDKRGTWAKFQINATGQIIYAVDFHFTADSSPYWTDMKLKQAAATAQYMDKIANGAPVLFLGDFNSSPYYDTNSLSVSEVLQQHGYYDAAATANRKNYRYHSADSDLVPDGHGQETYMTTPQEALNITTAKIDYIMIKNSPGSYSYTNQMMLDSKGNYDPAYHGSDHNLQLAVVGIH